ncbi:hypothetical protein AM10699_62030 (plasmid) [Acaryochloris marina MBIC10699]|nr:hypothetical protein AM10699_62030 [Acaryochloris marina MBIC10699]
MKMKNIIVRITSLNNQLGLIESLENSIQVCAKETYRQQGTQKVRLLDSNFKLSNSYVVAQRAELLRLDGKSIFSG